MLFLYIMLCALIVVAGAAAGWDAAKGNAAWSIFWICCAVSSLVIVLVSYDVFVE